MTGSLKRELQMTAKEFSEISSWRFNLVYGGVYDLVFGGMGPGSRCGV